MIPFCKSILYIKTWECPATPLPWTLEWPRLERRTGWLTELERTPFGQGRCKQQQKKTWQFPSSLFHSLQNTPWIFGWWMHFKGSNCSHSSELFHMLSVSACSYCVNAIGSKETATWSLQTSTETCHDPKKRLSWSHKPSTSIDA